MSASTRTENLIRLIDAAASTNGFGRLVDIEYTLLLAMKQGKRPVSLDTCRKVESALGLQPGWMDAQAPLLSPDTVALIHKASLPASKQNDSEEMAELRLANVYWLVGTAHGAKAEFCDTVGWHRAEFASLKSRGPLRGRRCRSIESGLGLGEGWLDQRHPFPVDFPDNFKERLEWARTTPPLFLDETPIRSEKVSSEVALAPLVGATSLAQIQSPIVRALVEKLIQAGQRGILPEARAVELLQELVTLETPKPNSA